MPPPEPPAYRAYCIALASAAALSVAGLAAWGGVRVDGTLAVVAVAAVIAAAIGTVAETDRTALSLVHLPVLAAALACAPPMAPLLGAALAVNDNRRFGRWVMLGNGGGLGLSAAASVGAFHALSSVTGHPEVGRPLWFLAATIAAVAFFAVNHGLVTVMIRLRYGAAAGTSWRTGLAGVAAADLAGSVIVVASLGLGAAVDEPAQRVVVGLVGVMTVGLLLAFLAAVRGRDAEMRARAEADAALVRADAARGRAEAAERAARMAEQRAQVAEQAALVRADVAVSQLHEVATGTVLALVALVDLKDRYTARHSAVVGLLCRRLAAELGWSPEDQALAHVCGLVHDIGKVGIPDALLRKPGAPTDDEWDTIRQHPEWGADALSNVAFSSALVQGVRSHHERWDGSGYAAGLSGEDIPVLGRLVAVCDGYDAMISRRPFRAARSPEEAVQEVRSAAGSQFDPRIAEAMVRMLEDAAPLEWSVSAAGFAVEWRRACVGIDMGRLYVVDRPVGEVPHPAVGA